MGFVRHAGVHPAWLAAGLAAAAPAHATNGYFSHGYSAAQRALGGAGTAYATDALVVSANPANLALVPERFDLNLGLFAPQRWYTAGERGAGAGPGVFAVEPGQLRSEHEAFGIPAMAYARPIDDRSSWGVALYGNGGMNTDYRRHGARFAEGLSGFETRCDGSFGGGPVSPGATDNAGLCGNAQPAASVDLIQLFVVPAYAYRVGDDSAIGIAPIFAAQRFTATGLGAFARFSNAPGKITENGYSMSTGYGYRVGGTLGLAGIASAGFSYQSRLKMSEFDEYAGLFAGQGGFDIPSNWNLGLALRVGERTRVLYDYQHVKFGEVPSVGNPLDPNRFVNGCALPRLGGDTAQNPDCLGAANGPGFGWRDVTTHKFGYEIGFEKLVLRAGYSRNRQPIPPGEVLFNILAPAVPQEHFTAGASYPLGSAWGLEMSAMYARNHPVTGKNPLSNAEATAAELVAAIAAPGTADTDNAFGSDPEDQDITLEMRQFEVMFGLSYRF